MLTPTQAEQAAKYYLKQQGLRATSKQIDKLFYQFPPAVIIRMAVERGFNPTNN